MSIKERMKNFPYKTLRQCQQAYHEEMQKAFDFSGVDTEKLKEIEACACIIYDCYFGRTGSPAKKAKEAKDNEQITGFFAIMKNATPSVEQQKKALEILFS